MTRKKFIQLTRKDLRAQLRQVVYLMVVIASFGGLGAVLVKRWEDQMLQIDRPFFWVLVGLGLLACAAAAGVVRVGDKHMLKCPHCRKCVGGVSSQVVVASGRCGFCGERIVDEP